MDRDLDLSLLRTFFTIAMTGSFTTASHRLFRTQPAISLRVKRLEDMIGFPLINRSTDGISLTREGTLLFGYAKRMLSLNDEVVERMRKEGAGELIRIGLPDEYTVVNLEKVLKTFAMDCPTASVTIDVKESGDLNDCLQKGRYDVIVRVDQAPPTNNRTTRRRPVVWVTGERTMLSRYDEVRLVLPAEGNLYRRLALQALTTANVPWDIVCTATTWTFAQSAVLAGMGTSAISLDMVTPGMRIVGIEDGLPSLPDIGISVVPRSQPASNALRRLTELLAESLPAGSGAFADS
jgi:DNA-binding transcriptional LysR family regulator